MYQDKLKTQLAEKDAELHRIRDLANKWYYEYEELYVAQLQGGRLPEGATKLPDGFKFRFLLVHIYNPTMEGD